ncbi:MAG: hypothetical protein WCX08_00090 [Candidatus Buchananbacteria bacterium]
MARISLEELIQKSEASLPVPEKPKRVRKRKLKTNCWLIFSVLLVIFLAAGLAVIAKTGIIEIPVFSSIFYRLPQPSRLIPPQNPADFSQKSVVYSYDEQNKILHAELTENELTFFVRQKLAADPKAMFAQNTQFIIDNGEIELFGLMIKPFTANLTLRMKANFLDNAGSYQVTQAKIGDLSLPPFIADWLLKQYANQVNKSQVKKFNIDPAKLDWLKDNIVFKKFELVSGKIVIEVMINAESIQKILAARIKASNIDWSLNFNQPASQ